MSEGMTERKAWERLPAETPKAFAAFQMYLEMPLSGEASEKRSLGNLARRLGLASDSGVAEWSSKYSWQERAIAYDSYRAASAITIKESALQEYQQNVVTTMSTQLAVLNEIIDRKLKRLLDKATIDPDDIGSRELKAIVDALAEKDDLARRLGSMPTGFTTEKTADPNDDEDVVYIIGGGG